MPVGDQKFYMLEGTEIDRTILLQYMIDFYNYKHPDTEITDFNEGSEIRNLLEAIATNIFHLEYNDQQILKASFLATSWGSWLDLFGEELKLPRDPGRQSQGDVTFSIPEPVNYLITIPQATRLVASDTGLYYDTYMTVEIPIGETSVDCPIYSVVPGAGTNAKADTITLFENTSLYPSVSVTNPEDCTGGTDTESDETYRQRLLDKKGEDGFGSLEYYKKLGKVDGVHDIALVTSSNGFTGKVLVNGYNKPLESSILAEVTSLYTNEKNLVYNQTFEVEEVDYTVLDLEIECGVTDEVEDQIFIDALTNFINGGQVTLASTQLSAKGCTINESVTNYQLMTMLETLPFVVQVTSITNDGDVFHKLTPDTDSVFKLGTVTITQEIVEE